MGSTASFTTSTTAAGPEWPEKKLKSQRPPSVSPRAVHPCAPTHASTRRPSTAAAGTARPASNAHAHAHAVQCHA